MTLVQRVCFIFRSQGSVFPQIAKSSAAWAEKKSSFGGFVGLCPHPAWYWHGSPLLTNYCPKEPNSHPMSDVRPFVFRKAALIVSG